MGIKKGRTYEDIYGLCQAEYQRNERRCSRPGNGKNLLSVARKKRGKSLEEYYGKKRALKIKSKRIKTLINKYGNDYQNKIKYRKWTKNIIMKKYKDIVDKYGLVMKSRIIGLYKSDGFCSQNVIIRYFGSLDEFSDEVDIPFRLPSRLGKGLGKKEKSLLDMYEMLTGEIVSRQYPVKTIKGLYFLDGYIKRENLAIEIDEDYHKDDTRQIKDAIREDAIREKLGCHFIRIEV